MSIIEMPPFQKIPDACRTTGLSQYYLRKGCKDGSIPHVKSGPVYLINVPKLLEQLGVPQVVIGGSEANGAGTSKSSNNRVGV